MKTKRIAALAAILALVAAASAQAQLRFDIDVMVPFKAGFINNFAQSGGVTISDGQFTAIPYVFPVPDLQALFQADLGLVRLGGGARFFTLIVESLVFPTAFAEVNLGPFSINSSVGGYLFGAFGIANALNTADLLLGDVNLGFAVTKSFRLTLGYFGAMPLNVDNPILPGVVYGGAKFVILPDKAKK